MMLLTASGVTDCMAKTLRSARSVVPSVSSSCKQCSAVGCQIHRMGTTDTTGAQPQSTHRLFTAHALPTKGLVS